MRQTSQINSRNLPPCLLKVNLGFTYIGLLVLISIMGLILAMSGTIWSFLQQREKERNLIYIGNHFRQAIARYYELTPGNVKVYPSSLQDLLQDNRYVGVQRHLRKVYRDPVTNQPDWGLVTAPQGGVMGVYSLSSKRPIKNANFKLINLHFINGTHYSDWKFVYHPAVKAEPLSR